VSALNFLFDRNKPKRPRIRKRGSRKRCDANVKSLVYVTKEGVRRTRSPRCRQWAMPNGRCRLHGGLSTGWKTDEGAERAIKAMVDGRRRWVERMKAEGRPLKCGQYERTPELRERLRQLAIEQNRRRREARTAAASNSPELKILDRAAERRRQERVAENRARRAEKFSRLAAADALKLRLGIMGSQRREGRRQARNAPTRVEVISFAATERILREQFDD
jgi:hypothetical protein